MQVWKRTIASDVPVAVEAETFEPNCVDADGDKISHDTHFADILDCWECVRSNAVSEVRHFGWCVANAREDLRKVEHDAATYAMRLAATEDAYNDWLADELRPLAEQEPSNAN